jgi:cathepsin F
MYKATIFFLLVSVCLCEMTNEDLFQKYQEFVRKYNKTYSSHEEMDKSFQIFITNYNAAQESSAKNCSGITKFSDVDPFVFKNTYLKLNTTNSTLNFTIKWEDVKVKSTKLRFLQDDEVPSSFDWRDKGALNDIQFQGSCGSCWAFATAANVESLYFIKYGILPKFSEQQLIDCDYANSACDGGIMSSAYEYLRSYGFQSAHNYPYLDYQGQCQYDSSNANNVVSDWFSAGTEDEEVIKEILYRTGPLAITINADLLQYYTGGVLNVDYYSCPYQPTHGVNLVGYGTDEYGLDYWTVRNTWGEDWGENGYFRIARGVGLCGVNMYVVSAILN